MTSDLVLEPRSDPRSALVTLGAWRGLARTVLPAKPIERERLVVVGNGMVGHRFCERLVELGATQRFEIVVLGEEATPAYDRVHLTDVLKGRPRGELEFRSASWYAEQGLELRLNERAVGIDRERRVVQTERGLEVEYHRLVLATGSSAVLPRVELEGGAELIPYRTIDDAERIRALAAADGRSGARVVIIGGGLLGIEAARTLQELGQDVLILEAASQLLPRQLDPEASAVLVDVLRAAGLELRLRARIARVIRSTAGARIELEGGESLEARWLVAAAGARAADQIARAAGLRCHARGGIEVGTDLRTSDPRIYAIGECAQHARVPHGLVAPGYAMADALATGLVARRARLGPQHAVTRLKLDLTEVNVLGNPLEEKSDEELVHRAPGVYRRLLLKKRRVVAAMVVGGWSELAALQRLVVGGKSLDPKRLRDFEREGKLGLDGATLPIVSWPANAVVCQCANVTCGSLKASLAQGHSSPVALGRATSAGTLCGSCRPLLAELCGLEAAAEPAAPRSLVVPGLVALAFALLIAFAPRLPFPSSLRAWTIQAIWTDSLAKQLSGFGVLALVAVGLSLSLRKRVKRFRFGSYSSFRLLHAILGVLALVALFLHTGFRLGMNLNLALSMVFLTSALSGALSALLPTTSAPDGRAALVSRTCRRVHDLTFWALPALVTFHALKTYYY